MKILITGASSGIGEAFLVHYLGEGHEVYSLSRTKPKGGEWVQCDLSQPETLEEKLSTLPIPDILINNAGIMILGDLDILLDEMLTEIKVNLLSAFIITRYFVPHLKKGASVLNIASTAGINESDFAFIYGMTKAGLISMTKSFAHHLASRKIRVNALCPGFTRTNLVPGDSPWDLINEVVPLKMEATPKMIADIGIAIIENPFMTGSIVVCDGGEVNG